MSDNAVNFHRTEDEIDLCTPRSPEQRIVFVTSFGVRQQFCRPTLMGIGGLVRCFSLPYAIYSRRFREWVGEAALRIEFNKKYLFVVLRNDLARVVGCEHCFSDPPLKIHKSKRFSRHDATPSP